MSSKSRKKPHPIDEKGVKSIESEIALHERKMRRAEELGQTQSANIHRGKIIQLQKGLDIRRTITM